MEVVSLGIVRIFLAELLTDPASKYITIDRNSMIYGYIILTNYLVIHDSKKCNLLV